MFLSHEVAGQPRYLLKGSLSACAQPPLELVRQALGQGGWYGRDVAFHALADVQFVAAMGPPGGSCTAVTDRLLRHFHCLALSQVPASCYSTALTDLPCIITLEMQKSRHMVDG